MLPVLTAPWLPALPAHRCVGRCADVIACSGTAQGSTWRRRLFPTSLELYAVLGQTKVRRDGHGCVSVARRNFCKSSPCFLMRP